MAARFTYLTTREHYRLARQQARVTMKISTDAQMAAAAGATSHSIRRCKASSGLVEHRERGVS
jgi:hypothetical protein